MNRAAEYSIRYRPMIAAVARAACESASRESEDHELREGLVELRGMKRDVQRHAHQFVRHRDS